MKVVFYLGAQPKPEWSVYMWE